jgi:hypothetical protein
MAAQAEDGMNEERKKKPGDDDDVPLTRSLM